MQGDAHHKVTRIAFELLKIPLDEEIVQSASYPDYVYDIEAKGKIIKGYSLWGNTFTSFQHFCIPNSTDLNTLFRGYNFKLDKSLIGLDIFDFPIIFHESSWFEGEAVDSFRKNHPMKALLDNSLYSNKSFDEITYISGAILAWWLETGIVLFPKLKSKIIGSIVHCLQDAWMRPHSHGELLNGHKDYEAIITHLVNTLDFSSCVTPIREWKGSRTEVERSAYYSYISERDIESMKSIIRNAVEATMFALKNLL